uniref:Macro domain-containing protein n=1 Tax=Gallus gallus TaxID=9031 RepID=A0A8V0Z7Q5_CHICK
MYPGNKRKKLWREEKERLLKMTLEERRKEYLREYVALKDIPTWMEEMRSKNESDGDQEGWTQSGGPLGSYKSQPLKGEELLDLGCFLRRSAAQLREPLHLQGENAKEDVQGKRSLSEKVSLYRGDITLLEVDAIVNAGFYLGFGLCTVPLPAQRCSSNSFQDW